MQFYRRIKELLEAVADAPPPPSSAIVQNVADTRITFDDVLSLIKKHEGHKNHVYLDSEGKKTVGIGFNLTRPDAPAILKSIGADYDKVISNYNNEISGIKSKIKSIDDALKSGFLSSSDNVHYQELNAELESQISGLKSALKYNSDLRDAEDKTYKKTTKRQSKLTKFLNGE